MAKTTFEPPPASPDDTTVLPMGDRSEHVDRYFGILANRRRRFCLYHLHQANEALPIRDLARAVEASLTPSEATVTDRILDAAVRQLVYTHLPKLRDVGLVRVTEDAVELESEPALPIRDWLSATAAVELDIPDRSRWPTEQPSTQARINPSQPADESERGYLSFLFGSSR